MDTCSDWFTAAPSLPNNFWLVFIRGLEPGVCVMLSAAWGGMPTIPCVLTLEQIAWHAQLCMHSHVPSVMYCMQYLYIPCTCVDLLLAHFMFVVMCVFTHTRDMTSSKPCTHSFSSGVDSLEYTRIVSQES